MRPFLASFVIGRIFLVPPFNQISIQQCQKVLVFTFANGKEDIKRIKYDTCGTKTIFFLFGDTKGAADNPGINLFSGNRLEHIIKTGHLNKITGNVKFLHQIDEMLRIEIARHYGNFFTLNMPDSIDI